MHMDNLISWDWKTLLQREKQLDFFANIVIPAAREQNEQMPHVMIICKYPRLTEFILKELLSCNDGNDIVQLDMLHEHPRDMVSQFFGNKAGSILVLKKGYLIERITFESFDVLRQVLSNGTYVVDLGTCPNIRTIRLDCQPFSLVACFENSSQIRSGLKQCFEHVIEISSISADELCILEIQAIAKENQMQFDVSATKCILQVSNGDYRMAGRCVKWIRDYMTVKGDHFTVIPEEYAKKVISLFR